jgi:hypothetical protein
VLSLFFDERSTKWSIAKTTKKPIKTFVVSNAPLLIK